MRRFVSENSRVGDHGPHRPNFPGMSTILMHSDIVGDLQKIVPSIGEFILPVQCLSQLLRASTNHADLALSQKTCEKRAVFFWRGLVDSTTARHMCMQMNICLPVATFSSIVYRLLEIWKTCLLHPPAKNLSCVCPSIAQHV